MALELSTDSGWDTEAGRTMMERYPTMPMGKDLRPFVVLAVSVEGVVVSEMFLFFDLVSYGLVGYLLTMVFCTLGLRYFASERDVLGAIAIVPMFRLVNLGVPVLVDATLLWLPLVYGSLIPGLYWYARSNPTVELDWFGRRVDFVGFLPFTLALTFVLATVEFQIIQPDPLIPLWHRRNVLVLGVVMVGFVGLAEELVFRGILQRVLVDRFGTVSGIVVASLLFGVVHSGYGLGDEIAFAAVVGLLFGLIYHATDSLALVVIAHGLLNVLVFGLFPFRGVVGTISGFP